MAIYTNTTGSARLKSYFETGDVPSAANFIDLIDSLAVYDGTLPLISGSSISTGSFAIVQTRKLEAIKVKGKRKPVEIFKVLT